MWVLVETNDANEVHGGEFEEVEIGKDAGKPVALDISKRAGDGPLLVNGNHVWKTWNGY